MLQDYTTIFEKIFNSSNEILNKLNNIEERLTIVEKKIDLVLPLLKDDVSIENLKELKNEDLIINKEDVLKAMEYRDYRSLIYIFKLYYKNKLNERYAYPIKITGKRSYEYYDKNKWNPDIYGYYSSNVICLNIQNLFIKFNEYEKVGAENFLLNQKFIYKLSDEKFKKCMFKSIIEEVRINNI